MRKGFLLFLATICLTGCGAFVSGPTTVQMPPHVILQNSYKTPIGYGLPVNEGVIVTADQLFHQEKGEIYWRGERLSILARDIVNGTVFLGTRWTGDTPECADVPPAVGEAIYWLEGANLAEEKVRSVAHNLLPDDTVTTNSISLSGEIEMHHVGAPVFNAKGKVYGLVVGGDRTKDVTYVTRMDAIKSFIKENLSEEAEKSY